MNMKRDFAAAAAVLWGSAACLCPSALLGAPVDFDSGDPAAGMGETLRQAAEPIRTSAKALAGSVDAPIQCARDAHGAETPFCFLDVEVGNSEESVGVAIDFIETFLRGLKQEGSVILGYSTYYTGTRTGGVNNRGIEHAKYSYLIAARVWYAAPGRPARLEESWLQGDRDGLQKVMAEKTSNLQKAGYSVFESKIEEIKERSFLVFSNTEFQGTLKYGK